MQFYTVKKMHLFYHWARNLNDLRICSWSSLGYQKSLINTPIVQQINTSTELVLCLYWQILTQFISGPKGSASNAGGWLITMWVNGDSCNLFGKPRYCISSLFRLFNLHFYFIFIVKKNGNLCQLLIW